MNTFHSFFLFFSTLQVLFQGYNFGIKYSYVVPINKQELIDIEEQKQDAMSYGWMQGGWKKCSVQCGGGRYYFIVLIL